MKGTINNVGYKMIALTKKGNTKIISMHRLVAIAFIPNPKNKPCINHKNGIKTDNRIKNLEWCTHAENSQHAYRTGLSKPSYGMKDKIGNQNKKSIPVNQICINTGRIIKTWDSLNCPDREYNWDFRNIHSCVKGKRQTAYGFKWEYA